MKYLTQTFIVLFLLLFFIPVACNNGSNKTGQSINTKPSSDKIERIKSNKPTNPPVESLIPQQKKEWAKGPPLMKGRFGAPIIYHNNHLYIIGGENGMDTYKSIEYARIKADGQLEPWQYANEMPIEIAWCSAVVSGNRIYLIGGSNGKNGTNILDTVLSVSINADGSLGEWKIEDNKLKMGRRAIGLVESDGYIYAIGGFNAVVLDSVERAKVMEDGRVGKWEYLTSLTKRRYILSSLKIENYIYALGGHFADGTSTKSIERAQILPDGRLSKWEETSSMSSTRFMSASVEYNNDIFIIGGSQGGNIKNTIEYSVITDKNSIEKWKKSKLLLSETRGGPGAVFVGKSLYVIGGANRQSVLPTVYRIVVSPDYTLKDKIMIKPLINPRYLMPVETYKNRIYVIGGFDDHNKPYNSIEITKVNSDGSISEWSTDNSLLNMGRGWHSSVIHNDYLYVIGGFDGKNELKFNEYTKIQPDGSLGKWQLITPLSTSRKGTATAVVGSYIYAFGGFNDKRLRSVERAPINKNGTLGRWTILDNNLIVPRSGHRAAVKNNYVYIIGGLDDSNNPVKTIERAKILPEGKIGGWEKIPGGMTAERYAFGFSVIDDHFFVVGGLSKSQFMNNIEVASVDKMGHLTNWRNTLRLPGPQPGTAAIIAKGNMYTIGGLSKDVQKIVNHIPIQTLAEYNETN